MNEKEGKKADKNYKRMSNKEVWVIVILKLHIKSYNSLFYKDNDCKFLIFLKLILIDIPHSCIRVQII